jgi:M-phase inducer phosphatase 2
MREIRERDRALNKHAYPRLNYPEIYLLEGGYSQFYAEFPHLCTPQGYLPMLHDNHRTELKHFRKKSKTWEMETRKKAVQTKTKLSF